MVPMPLFIRSGPTAIAMIFTNRPQKVSSIRDLSNTLC